MLVLSLSHCKTVLFIAKQQVRILIDFPNLANACDGGNGMMMAPFAHPLHMKVVNQLSYVICECGSHFMLGNSLSYYDSIVCGPAVSQV
jgi:hypothetical protein